MVHTNEPYSWLRTGRRCYGLYTSHSTPCWLLLLSCSQIAVNIVDTDLHPYTQYNYSVTASNSVGSVTSDLTTATTLEAQPQQLAAPICHTDSHQLDIIYLSWSPPAIANGVPILICLTSVYYRYEIPVRVRVPCPIEECRLCDHVLL